MKLNSRSCCDGKVPIVIILFRNNNKRPRVKRAGKLKLEPKRINLLPKNFGLNSVKPRSGVDAAIN